MRGFLDRLDFDFSDSAQDGSLWEVTHDGNSLKIKDVNCGICGYEGEGKGNVPCGYGKAVNCGYKIDFGGNELSESEGWGADSFEGYYQNGVKHGKGIYRFANGTELEGEWENGVLKSGTYNFYFSEDGKKSHIDIRETLQETIAASICPTVQARFCMKTATFIKETYPVIGNI